MPQFSLAVDPRAKSSLSVTPHSSDDVDYRGSTTTLYQPSTAAHSASQAHPPPSMPWLGSGQTSTGASVVGSFPIVWAPHAGSLKPAGDHTGTGGVVSRDSSSTVVCSVPAGPMGAHSNSHAAPYDGLWYGLW